MSKTPETDVAWNCFKGCIEPLQDVKELSRKLERERDILKNHIEIMNASRKTANDEYFKLAVDNENLEIALTAAIRSANVRQDETEKAMAQLDKAMKTISELQKK